MLYKFEDNIHMVEIKEGIQGNDIRRRKE